MEFLNKNVNSSKVIFNKFEVILCKVFKNDE